MIRYGAKLGKYVVGGAMTEAMRRQLEEREPSSAGLPRPPVVPPPTEGGFQKGDAKLAQVADKLREPIQDPTKAGVQGFIQSRVEFAQGAAQVGGAVVQGELGVQNVTQAVSELVQNVKFAAQVADVYANDALDGDDAQRVVRAGVNEAAEKAWEKFQNATPLEAAKQVAEAAKAGARGFYAGSTTSKAGVQEVNDAMAERARYEAQKVGTTAAVAVGVGAVVGMVNPVAGMVVRGVGAAAAGYQASGALHEMHGNSEPGEMGAVRRELNKVIEEKSRLGSNMDVD
ncbi:hypothetical protein DRW03_11195 [Corallococcus sp. H22C18031201]|uniref:hypothetical protein n=1 Tax=Citreicoccus inhibens TaxID=2849499 RepID=UPI000E70E393|nr:hypothetical protein [Citreicoccus inhibens]MBU8898790.1 hypothetical protein [Citreicoccus inhibens]RJS24160.1 hypothetical protein DRW03_11195 [Corallococcus sp. H22C18031201]